MTKVQVYLDYGAVFEYCVSDLAKGREHASAIIKTGYRRTDVNGTDLEWFPPHRIIKVKVIGGAVGTNYSDEARPT